MTTEQKFFQFEINSHVAIILLRRVIMRDTNNRSIKKLINTIIEKTIVNIFIIVNVRYPSLS